MATPQHQLVNGPSREALFDALRLIGEDRSISVEWVRPDDGREESRIVVVSIAAMTNKGETGQWWKVQGLVLEMEGDNSVTLLYDTKSRTGSIRFGATDQTETDWIDQVANTLHDQEYSDPLEAAPDRIHHLRGGARRVGFFVKVIAESSNASAECFVGPFDSYEVRAEWIANWKKTLEDSETEWETIALGECALVPDDKVPVRPEDFRGFIKLDDQEGGA